MTEKAGAVADEPELVRVVIATFSDVLRPDRALASIAPALDAGIGMAAIVSRTDDGKVRFVETHDHSAVQGAVEGGRWGAIGGLIGLVFGPVALLGAPIGAAVGALVAKLRDSGFDDEDLRGLGDDLAPGSAALVVTVNADDVARATRMLRSELGAERVIVKEIDVVLADALDELSQPLPPPSAASRAEA